MKRRRFIHIILSFSGAYFYKCNRLLSKVLPRQFTHAKMLSQYPGKIKSMTEKVFHTIGRWSG